MAASPKAGAKRSSSAVDVEFDVDTFLAETPDTDMESMVLGIDEAGRGPVLGDMVYGCAMIPLSHHDRLLDCGVNDSKQLNEAKREASLAKMKQIPELQVFMRRLDASEISEAMTGRNGKTLNTISHDAAIDMIREATLAAGGKLAAAYIDTVGIPEVYTRKLQARFPHLKIIVTSKADAKFPIVSAASIYAKTTRDHHMAEVSGSLGKTSVMSGYPGDEATARWVSGSLHKFFGFSEEFVRQSWAPVQLLEKEHCVKIEFEHDVEKELLKQGVDPKQRQLSFAKLPPSRDILFTNLLGLSTAYSLDEKK